MQQQQLTNSIVNKLATKDQDMKQRRVVNSAPSKDDNDCVIRKELDDTVAKIKDSIKNISSFTALVSFFGKVLFYELVLFGKGLITPLIYPPVDGVSALNITKANGTTSLLTFDTTTPLIKYHCSTVLDSQLAHYVGTSPTVKRLKLYYDSTIDLAQINAHSGAAFTTMQIDSINLQINSNSAGATVISGTIGFFGAAAIGKQTLNVYASNSQGSSYSGIASGVAGTPYAQVADLNALRVAYQNLLTSYNDLRAKLQTTTLVG